MPTDIKPPPPYTPPAISAYADLPRSPRKPPPIKQEPPSFVPSSKEELPNYVTAITKTFLKNRHTLDMSPDEFQTLLADETPGSSRATFLKFLCDFIKAILSDLFKAEMEAQNPPWMRQKPLFLLNMTLSDDQLVTRVQREVMVAFNHQKKTQKENMIIRWPHKRRDRVDQVLVRELHAEEAAWTNYEDDEVQVKDDLSNLILEALIDDTTRAFKQILLRHG